MNLEQIELLKIEDCQDLLIKRLDEQNNIQPDEVTGDWSIETLEEEFNNYKIELIEAETARINEINRQSDLKQRWAVLKARDAGMPCFRKIHPEICNPDAYLRDNVGNKDKAAELEELFVAIEAEDKKLVEEINSNKYQELRKAEYGSIAEQLDEQFHNYDAWKARIKSIKDKYPKS